MAAHQSKKIQRSAAIRISTPFESESGTSIFYTEEGNYPPEMNPKPIHINPRVFVDENVIDQPIRSDERTRAKDELDDPTEEEIEEFVGMAFEVWEGEVRNRLKTEAESTTASYSTAGRIWSRSSPARSRDRRERGNDRRRTYQRSGYGPGTVFWTLLPRVSDVRTLPHQC
jgi:hypothetical protein